MNNEQHIIKFFYIDVLKREENIKDMTIYTDMTDKSQFLYVDNSPEIEVLLRWYKDLFDNSVPFQVWINNLQ